MIPRATLADVAREAQVSLTTASHALNGKGRVDLATREHVTATASRLGYVPSRTARNLALGRSDTLGLLLPELPAMSRDEVLATDWYGRLAVGASQEAIKLNRALAILPGLHSAEQAAAFGLEAVIVLDPLVSDPRCAILDEAGVPYVMLGRDPDRPQMPYISYDTAELTHTLLDHLVSEGAQRVALLVPDVDWSGRDTPDVYRSWCKTQRMKPTISVASIAAAQTRDELTRAARDAARKLLQRRERPDAIVGLFENFGLGIIAAAESLNLRVPGDLLVAQDIDSIYAQLASPPITAIDVAPAALIARAVAKICGADEDAAGPTNSGARLIVRGSTSRRLLDRA